MYYILLSFVIVFAPDYIGFLNPENCHPGHFHLKLDVLTVNVIINCRRRKYTNSSCLLQYSSQYCEQRLYVACIPFGTENRNNSVKDFLLKLRNKNASYHIVLPTIQS
jgi:hypothetical protein